MAIFQSCDLEAIHTPGSIQPHGMMLVADAETGRITHAAGDVETRLGWTDWHGHTLQNGLGAEIAGAIAGLCSNLYVGSLPDSDGQLLDISAHVVGRHVVVEIEPAAEAKTPASMLLDTLAAASTAFSQAPSLASLSARAAQEFRRLTGFDRVMVYRFLADGAGVVIGEDLAAGLSSFLNHHFPATDIPEQARALYLRNVIRVIPDAQYRPAPLRPDWTDPTPLDLSDSSLRSVSPLHLQYLANMGVRASASVSIVKDGTLWGLIACHNATPRHISYEARAACRALAGGLARQIKMIEEADFYRQRLRLRSFEDDIIRLLSRDGSLDQALSRHLNDIGRMFASDGVAVLRGAELVTSGVLPPQNDILALAHWLRSRGGDPVVSSNQLAALYPQAGSFRESGSGLLAITLSHEEPWQVLWFNTEQIETVNWAGNPYKDNGLGTDGMLTPRASFEAWQQTVRGSARAWTAAEVQAATRLRASLLEVRQNRRVLDLNHQLTAILQEKDHLLQQKEFLIGEVNHRVQNSLQLVSSFLGMQSRASSDPGLQAALEEARRRLAAVSLVHRRLYRVDQIQEIDLARYIEDLSADTITAIGEDWARHLSLKLTPTMISADRAVTVGLILTELMINANKYAYDGAAGPLEIVLSEDRDSIQMVVADKGRGTTATGGGGFGSRMMHALVSQLHGTLTHAPNNPGLRAIMAIPANA